MKTEEQLAAELEIAQAKYSEDMQKAMDAPSVDEFMRLGEIASRELRPFAQAYKQSRTQFKLTPIEEDDDVYTLEEFVENCEDGGFIDYDGSGNYATATHETDISIYPSDVISGSYRKDFTHVVWYNR